MPEQTLPGIPFIQERASIKFSERGGYRVKAFLMGNSKGCTYEHIRILKETFFFNNTSSLYPSMVKCGTAFFHKADITKEYEVQQVIKKCLSVYDKIDAAVNNAGICIGSKTTAYTEEQFDRVIQVNLKGTWLCMKHEILNMKKRWL